MNCVVLSGHGIRNACLLDTLEGGYYLLGNASSLGLFENGLLYQANVHAGLQRVMRIRGRRNQSYYLSWGRSGLGFDFPHVPSEKGVHGKWSRSE